MSLTKSNHTCNMLIRLVFSNIVDPWYFFVILRTDVQCNLMEHSGHIKRAVKTNMMGVFYIGCIFTDRIIKIHEYK